MKKTYIYKGQNKIELVGYGVVFPGDEIILDYEIRNCIMYIF
jgi:hypothetical protein